MADSIEADPVASGKLPWRPPSLDAEDPPPSALMVFRAAAEDRFALEIFPWPDVDGGGRQTIR